MRELTVAILIDGPSPGRPAAGIRRAIEAEYAPSVRVFRDARKFAASRADVLVVLHPTWAIYDAMCRGVVVVTDQANKFLSHMNNFVRPASLSPDAIVSAIRRITQDRHLLSIISRQARTVHHRCTRSQFVSGFTHAKKVALPLAPPPNPVAPPKTLPVEVRPSPSAEETPPPLVSVIMPCYNDEDTVAESIRSVLSQTWGRLELIVVDDGSTDRTIDSIPSADSRVTVAFKRNGGPSSARNLGLRLIDPGSAYVAFLDSDDLWEPVFLERAVTLLEGGDGSVGLVYCDSKVTLDGELQEVMRAEYTWPKLINGWGIIPTGTFVVRRKVSDLAGSFDEEIERGEDLEWMWRIGLCHDFAHIKEILHHYRRASGGQLATASMNTSGLERKRRQYLAVRGPADPIVEPSRRSAGAKTLANGARRGT